MPSNPNNPLLQSILSEPGAVPLLRCAGNGSDDEILIIEDFGPSKKLASHSVSKNACAVSPVKPQPAAAKGPHSKSDDEPELTKELPALSVPTKPKETSTAVVEPQPKRWTAAAKPIRWHPSQCRDNLWRKRKRVLCTGELVDLDPPPPKKLNVQLTIEKSFERTVSTLEDFRTGLMDLRVNLEKKEECRLKELQKLKKKGKIAMEDYKSEIEWINSSKRKRFVLFMSFSSSIQLMTEGLDILTDEAISTLNI